MTDAMTMDVWSATLPVTMQTTSPAPVTATEQCENFQYCSDCLLHLCVFIMLNKGKFRCVDPDRVMEFSRDFETRNIVSSDDGSDDNCRDNYFNKTDKFSPEQHIRHQKLNDPHFDPLSAPTITSGLTTNVSLGMTVRSLEVDEQDSSFLVLTDLRLEWKDDRLSWATNDSYILKTVYYLNTEIWNPRLLVHSYTRPTTTKELKLDEEMLLKVHPNGSVSSHRRPGYIRSSCELNLFQWPGDSQTCNITLAMFSPTPGINVTDLRLLSETSNNTEQDVRFDLEGFEDSYWKVVNWTATRKEVHHLCCPEHFVDIVFSFTVKRIWSVYVYLLILYLCFVAVSNIKILFHPLLNTVKLVLVVVNTIIVALILGGLSYFLKANTQRSPLLVALFEVNLFPCIFSLLVGGIVMLGKLRRPHPIFLQITGNVFVERYLFCGRAIPIRPDRVASNNDLELNRMDPQRGPPEAEAESSDEEIDSVIAQRKVIQAEWDHIVIVSHRLALYIYFLLTIIILYFFWP